MGKYFISFLLTVIVCLQGYAQSESSSRSRFKDPAFVSLEKSMLEDKDAYRAKFLALEQQLIMKKQNDQLVDLYFLHADYLYKADLFDSMVHTLHHLKTFIRSEKNEKMAHVYLLLSSAYYFKSNYDSLVYWQTRAEKLITKESPYYGEYLLIEGLKNYFNGTYSDAIKKLLEALSVFESLNDASNLALTYNNLSLNYEKLGNISVQQEYLLKAIEVNKILGDTYNLIANYNNLGVSYKKQNLLKKALETYDLAYQTMIKLNAPMLLAQNFTNKANIYEKLGDLKTAEQLFLDCERLCEENGIAYGAMLTNINLGNLYRQMKNYSQSQLRLEKSLEMAISLQAQKERALCYERLAWLARDRNDFQAAYNYTNRFYALNDSLVNESVQKEALALKEKFESEKRGRQIITLSKEKLYQQYVLVLMGLGLMVLLVLIQWWRYKHRLAMKEREKHSQELKFQLEMREKELLTDSLKKVSIMQMKESIYGDLKALIQDLPRVQSVKFAKILKELQADVDQSVFEEFETRFLGVYERFFTRLKELAPELSPTELRICALIRLNLSTKEIVAITNRTVGTIDNARSKIRKKLQLGEEDNLQLYLSNIS